MKTNRKIITLTVLLLLCASGYSEPVWVIDDLRTGVLDAPARNAGFSGTLVAGSPVERLETSSDGLYTKIRTDTLEGWVMSRNLTDQPSLRSQFEEQINELSKLKQELAQLRGNDGEVSEENERLKNKLEVALVEAQRNRDELLSLQRASENVVKIDSLNRELQNKVVHLEQMNLRLTQKNTRLAEQSQHSQMVVGGALVGCGMVAFWLLSLLGNLRRRSSFNDF